MPRFAWSTAALIVLSMLFAATVSAQMAWNVDLAVTGTVTPLGGSDNLGFGPAVSVAVTKDDFKGERNSGGLGIVGMFMPIWAGSEGSQPSHREDWILADPASTRGTVSV